MFAGSKSVQWHCSTCHISSRLVALQILPLMMQFELYYLTFFIRCLKDPYVTFCASSTRSSTHFKLKHSLSRTNIIGHFYFNRLPRLWNSLPAINLNQSTSSIRKKLTQFLWNHFMCHFRSDSPCTLHFLCPCAKCLCLPIYSL